MKVIKLPFKIKSAILACGADLKGAFALAKGRSAYLFDGFGDLSDLDNFTRYEKAVKVAEKKLKISPRIVVCDLHPGYFSTQFAKNYAQQNAFNTLYEAQHHEAHIASAIVDNDVRGDVFGVAFDGTGYGLDGNVWGGEFFFGNIRRMKRAAHLGYIPMPGGETCIKEPWRMAASYLYSIFGEDFLKLKLGLVRGIGRKKWVVLKHMIDKKINSPLTSSAGRLFDAAGSLVLNKRIAEFEAQLPMELERIAAAGVKDSYSHEDGVSMIKGLVKDAEKGLPSAVISAKFHNSVAMMILNAAKKFKIKNVILSGGVFQNRYLREKASDLLNKNGFYVYTHARIETNDSGIPLGQIAIANARVFRLCIQ